MQVCIVIPGNTEPTKKDEITDAVKAEEKNFFNQPAPSEKEKSKMTKDSIMALYGSAPPQPIVYPNPVGTFQPTVPQNAFPQTYQYPAQGFPPNFNQQPFPIQNGSPHIPNIATNMTPNPYVASNLSQPTQTMPFGQSQQFITAPFGQSFGGIPQNQFQPNVGANVPMGGTPNPFCGPMPMQQQFAGLSLTGAQVNNANVGKPAAANIWQ